MADVDISQFIEYCSSLADEFEARRNRVRKFVKKNNLASGTANEAILRNFLATITAGSQKVSQGFICDPVRSLVSRQCDILVHETRFPLVYAEGEIKIVWPESVRMAIEVKTSMNDRESLRLALQNIKSIKETSTSIIGLVFSFGSLTAETAMDLIKEEEIEMSSLPNAILLLERGIIIHQPDIFQTIHYGGGKMPFEIGIGKEKNKQATVLAYLLFLFLRMQSEWSKGLETPQNLISAMDKFIQEETHLYPTTLTLPSNTPT